MRFLMTTTGGDEPDERLMAEMGRFVEELTKAVGDGEGDIRQVFGPE